MNVILIAAIGKNRELGKQNHLIWQIPRDLQFFKQMTMGKTIVMGRKTFESLPKILSDRRHVVLSRTKNDFPSEIIVYDNLEQLLLTEKEELFIIGGEQIYQLFLAHASKMYLTLIDAEDKNADAYFPEFEEEQWNNRVLDQYEDVIHYKHVEYVKKVEKR